MLSSRLAIDSMPLAFKSKISSCLRILTCSGTRFNWFLLAQRTYGINVITHAFKLANKVNPCGKSFITLAPKYTDIQLYPFSTPHWRIYWISSESKWFRVRFKKSFSIFWFSSFSRAGNDNDTLTCMLDESKEILSRLKSVLMTCDRVRWDLDHLYYILQCTNSMTHAEIRWTQHATPSRLIYPCYFEETSETSVATWRTRETLITIKLNNIIMNNPIYIYGAQSRKKKIPESKVGEFTSREKRNK